MACCGCGQEKQEVRWAELDKIIAKYQGQPGALIPVLHEAQELFGYLPEDVQERIAAGLNIPVSEVYGVVTFYSLFTMQPRGKYTINLCMGTACYVKGAAGILAALEEELGIKPGETSNDGRFTLEITRCMGACGLAPVMTIGEDIYGRLEPSKVGEILKKYN